MSSYNFNNSIYATAPNAKPSVTVNTGIGGTVTIPPLSGTITTSTITSSTSPCITSPSITSPSTYTVSPDWGDLDLDESITIGKHEITEDILGDLLIMLEVIKELDDSNKFKDMFNTIKMLNKIKGEKNIDLPK